MTGKEAQEILAKCGRMAARKEALRLDEEIRMWMRCGFDLTELQLLHFQHPRQPSEVVPKIFERLTDG